MRMEALQIVHERIKILRRIERILETYPLTLDQKTIQSYIDTYDDNGLEQALYKNNDLTDLSLRQLRAKAKTYFISYYTLMGRMELIRAIHDARRKYAKGDSPSPSLGSPLRPSDSGNREEASGSSTSVS